MKELIRKLKEAIEPNCYCKACVIIPIAIETLKRIDVEKIEEICIKTDIVDTDYISSKDLSLLSQAIVNYLTEEKIQ